MLHKLAGLVLDELLWLILKIKSNGLDKANGGGVVYKRYMSHPPCKGLKLNRMV